MFSEPAIDVNDAGIRPPRTAQKHAFGRILSSNLAVDEYKSGIGIRRNAALRGNVALPAAVNFAVLENGGGVAEDKIHVTFDEAIAVILPAARGV